MLSTLTTLQKMRTKDIVSEVFLLYLIAEIIPYLLFDDISPFAAFAIRFCIVAAACCHLESILHKRLENLKKVWSKK